MKNIRCWCGYSKQQDKYEKVLPFSLLLAIPQDSIKYAQI